MRFSRLGPGLWAFGLLFGHCTFRANVLLETADLPNTQNVGDTPIRIPARRTSEPPQRPFDRGAPLEHTDETVDAIIRDLEREFGDESKMRPLVMAAVWMSALVICAGAAAVLTTVTTGIWPGFH
jgi:hypothetical protein